MLKFEENYWEGKHCLENESPWIVPSAAHLLDETLNKNDYVIEVGTGGSTLYYAKKCGYVHGIETDKTWGNRVLGRVVSSNYKNVRYSTCTSVSEMKSLYNVDRLINFIHVTVLSVDTIQGYNRSDIFEFFLCKYLHSLRILVLDNYSEHTLWPDHWNMPEGGWVTRLGPQWAEYMYDDNHWYGSGTKICIKT